MLGSLNLAEFVTEDKQFDFDALEYAVDVAIEALNEVLEEGLPLHPLQEQRDSVETWKQVGCGIMGLADMLIKMNLTYGSLDSIQLCDKIGYTIANAALKTSAYLAKDHGAFEKCNADEITTTPFFIVNADEVTKDLTLKYGLRNSQLLTIAPTGTLSTMLGISGGIEPIFANSYTRTTKSLHGEDVAYKVYTPIVQRYMELNGLINEEDLPEWFITAQTIGYQDRIRMQSIWQKHIDASISSTVNLPETATKEDVYNIYLEAWGMNLKGITIFRDGCKRTGILTTKDTNNTSTNETTLKRGDVIAADDNVIGLKRKLTTGCGTLHCTAFFDPITGDLLETYLSKGSTGGCLNSLTGLSRMISLSARAGVDIQTIVDQLDSTGSCPSYAVRTATKRDTSKGACCPMAVGRAIMDMYNEMQATIEGAEVPEMNSKTLAKVTTNHTESTKKAQCPTCGADLIFEGGCVQCKECGWSKCE